MSLATFTANLQKHMPAVNKTLGIISGLAGTGIQMSALIDAGKAEQAVATYNASLRKMAGDDEARRQRHVARQTLSSQFVQQSSKSGLEGDYGGWLEVLSYNAGRLEMDAVNEEIAAANDAELIRVSGNYAQQTQNRLAGASLIAGLNDFRLGIERIR